MEWWKLSGMLAGPLVVPRRCHPDGLHIILSLDRSGGTCMEQETSIIATIRERSSHRTYDGQPLPGELRLKLGALLEAPPEPPFGGRVRMALVDSSEDETGEDRKLGTYGMISGARSFIVGVVGEGGRNLEDFGYLFEWAILQATAMGLATCWIGGTLKRSSFGQAAGAGPDEIVPAVSPVGRARRRRSLLDSAVRLMASSRKRKPWAELFFEGDLETPLSEEAAGPHASCLEMVRLAPSASNRQPWRMVRDPEEGGRFDLYLRRNRLYGKLTTVDLQRIDMGIAMAHFELSARELGLPGRWKITAPGVAELPEHTEYVASWLPPDVLCE